MKTKQIITLGIVGFLAYKVLYASPKRSSKGKINIDANVKQGGAVGFVKTGENKFFPAAMGKGKIEKTMPFILPSFAEVKLIDHKSVNGDEYYKIRTGMWLKASQVNYATDE